MYVTMIEPMRHNPRNLFLRTTTKPRIFHNISNATTMTFGCKCMSKNSKASEFCLSNTKAQPILLMNSHNGSLIPQISKIRQESSLNALKSHIVFIQPNQIIVK
uniref:Uncharacterized protein n=1 Tax=Opuntia streptacantha TaxID=393608 RepID=A0A7C9CGS1_OPUST